jgi:hypothetical protein
LVASPGDQRKQTANEHELRDASSKHDPSHAKRLPFDMGLLLCGDITESLQFPTRSRSFCSLGASGIEAGTAFPELARRGDPDRFHYLEVLVLELDVPYAPKVSKSAVVLWPGSLS